MHSHRPRKRFGQHFLHDPWVRSRIVRAIDPRPGDFLVEIGPGEGALTFPLADAAGRLAVVELDRDLAARFKDERVEVHCADALAFDFGRFPAGMRLVGNLPYNISTPLLFHLAGYAGRVRDMHFMLQREVVERMVAAPSTRAYGRLSVTLQVRFRMAKLFSVPRGAFRPSPKVESALVRLEPLPAAAFDEERFGQVVRQAFSARRKKLSNALPDVELAALGIDPALRPEDLSPVDYLRITNALATRAR